MIERYNTVIISHPRSHSSHPVWLAAWLSKTPFMCCLSPPSCFFFLFLLFLLNMSECKLLPGKYEVTIC